MMFYNGFNLFIDICIALVVGYLFYNNGYRNGYDAGHDHGYEQAAEESYDGN